MVFGHSDTDYIAMTRMGVVARQPLRAVVTNCDVGEMASGIAHLAAKDGGYNELVVVVRAPYEDELPTEMRKRLDWLVPTGARVRGHLVDERLGTLESDLVEVGDHGPREAGELLSILERRPLDIDDAL